MIPKSDLYIRADFSNSGNVNLSLFLQGRRRVSIFTHRLFWNPIAGFEPLDFESSAWCD